MQGTSLHSVAGHSLVDCYLFLKILQVRHLPQHAIEIKCGRGELPHLLRDAYPSVYAQLVAFYRQDPADRLEPMDPYEALSANERE